MPTNFHAGPQFQVNATGSKQLLFSQATSLPDGRFIVTWLGDPELGETTLYQAQIFNADGSKSGTELSFGSSADFHTLPPRSELELTQTGFEVVVTGLANGGFVLTWVEFQPTENFSHQKVFSQIFDDNGTAASVPFAVPQTDRLVQVDPDVALLSDGRFVVTWSDGLGVENPSETVIYAQVFNPDGSRSGDEFQVNTTSLGLQLSPSVTGLSNGRYVVTWTDQSNLPPDTSGQAVRMQMFNADGTPFGTEQVVNTSTLGSQGRPDITATSDGGFVVTWSDWGPSAGAAEPGAGISGQKFSADGVPVGDEFNFSSALLGPYDENRVVALSDGRFMITWSEERSAGADTDGYAVYAQVFNADGTTQGDEFVVNTITDLSQKDPDITLLKDGRVLVTWSGRGLDGDAGTSDISAQFLDLRETALNLAAGGQDDQLVGTEFADRISGGAGDDRLWGGKGRDVLTGDLGWDSLFGDAGRDVLRGSGGQDRLNGGNGEDRLNGGGGRDNLNGGRGDDVLFGGAGKDKFVFSKGNDVVRDFDAHSSQEKIDMRKVGAIDDFADLMANHLTQLGQNVVIDDLNGNTMTLNGVDLADLGADDFLF